MTPTETERDLDDYSEEFDANSHDDFESNHVIVYDEDRVSDPKVNLDNDIDGDCESKLDELQNDSLSVKEINDTEIVNDSKVVKTQEDILNEILEDSPTDASSSDLKPKSLNSKSDGISDPLRDFTDVDLS